MPKDTFPTSEISKITSSSDQAAVSLVHSGTSYWLWFGRPGEGPFGSDVPAACAFVQMVRESDHVSVDYSGTLVNGQYPANFINVASKPLPSASPAWEPWTHGAIILLLALILATLIWRRRA